jgi:hypothetical protein
VSLVDYATARNRPNDPPSVVVKCINEIEERGALPISLCGFMS